MADCKLCDGDGIIEIAHSNGSLGYTICECQRANHDDDEPAPLELEALADVWQ